MNPIRCLVVDDEELARTLLENYISRMPTLSHVASCANAMDAMVILQDQPVDLMFLDIQMPELTGVEFLRTLPVKPVVVFTTAYAEYALEGYALDVTDYLLKPFGFERFVQAVNKAAAVLRGKSDTAAAAPGETAKPGKDYIMVKADHKLHRIKLDDILFIQGMREYVAFHTPNGRILSLNSLKSLEEALPAAQFIRIHKSYIAAVNRIEILEGNLVRIGKEKLPVGALYRDSVHERLS